MKPIRALFFLLTVTPALNAATFVTTSVYDENIIATNTVDVEAVGSTISLASFTSLVSAAFTAETGGVMDFELANGAAGNLTNTATITASYGASQANTLTITSGGLSNFSTNNNNIAYLSGTRYLGHSDGSGQKFRFGTSLETIGFTVLSRNAAASTITTTIFFADLTSVTFAGFNLPTTGGDTFVGYTSPTNLITGVDVVSTGGSTFARIDDFGFVVPEPSSALLGSLGVIALLRRRRL